MKLKLLFTVLFTLGISSEVFAQVQAIPGTPQPVVPEICLSQYENTLLIEEDVAELTTALTPLTRRLTRLIETYHGFKKDLAISQENLTKKRAELGNCDSLARSGGSACYLVQHDIKFIVRKILNLNRQIKNVFIVVQRLGSRKAKNELELKIERTRLVIAKKDYKACVEGIVGTLRPA